MRYPASEKLEIIRLVEQSHLPVTRTLSQLGIPKTIRRVLRPKRNRCPHGKPPSVFDLDDVDAPVTTVGAGYCGRRESEAGRGAFAMKIETIGLDLAKSVFQAHGVDADGKAVLVKRYQPLGKPFRESPSMSCGVNRCNGEIITLHDGGKRHAIWGMWESN